MIKYNEVTGELCLSDGTRLPTAVVNGRSVIYEHYLAWAMHHDYLPRRIGRVDGDIRNTRVDNLYDMDIGPPVTDAMAVKNCRLYKILMSFETASKAEVAAIQRPIPDHVREEVRGFFRAYGNFVRMGDVAVDKRTGGSVKLRDFVLRWMVEAEDLCYYDDQYRLMGD